VDRHDFEQKEKNMKTGDPMYTVKTLVGEEAALPLNCISAQIGHLRADIRTIAEAVIVPDVQRDAVKRLIDDAFEAQLRHIESLAYPTFANVSESASLDR
jgi:hypothetical protein